MRLHRAALVAALCCLVQSAAYTLGPCRASSPPGHGRHHGARPIRHGAVMAAAANDEGAEPSDDLTESAALPLPDITPLPWQRDLATLQDRIVSLEAEEERFAKFEALPSAWVLVFDAETDDEAVYSMQIDGGDSDDADDGDHVVLAFEDEADAKAYASSLADEEASSIATVQALDFEALVVTSRNADFGVAVVFQGDVGSLPALDERNVPIFASDAGAALSVSISMVPAELYSDKDAADYIDPSEDPIWVLVHDAGTADAQYFSMMLNGSDSIVCFRDEDSASRCGEALQSTGMLRGPSTQRVLLEELLEALDEERDVCLVDEVVEQQMLDGGPEEGVEEGGDAPVATDDETRSGDGPLEVVGSVGSSKCSATPAHVLKALEALYERANATSSDGDLECGR